MTVPKSNEPLTTVSIVPMATSTKVHSFVRQTPVTSTSFQASQEETSRGDHNGRVSIQPTSFEGGLLVGLYDPHLGPQCAEYLQQHLVPILDESLSTQLDHSDDDLHHAGGQNPNTCKIDPNQVIDTLKSTFLELDELLLATAITVALAQPEDTELASVEDIKKTQEVVAQVVTGSTALVGFLAPHTSSSSAAAAAAAAATSSTTTNGSEVIRHDLYLAHLGDSVAILAGLDSEGQWTARRLNPPETHEHSVRYLGSEEYRRVISEAKERGLTAEQFLSQHNGHHQKQHSECNNNNSSNFENDLSGESLREAAHESFLTRGGKFLGLPVTRAFGDLDWKIEQEARYSVANWVEKSLRAKIDKALGGGHQQQQQQQQQQPSSSSTQGLQQDEVGINNLNDPPYVGADPQISRFVLETRKQHSASANINSGPSDQQLILLSRGLLYRANSSTGPEAASSSSQHHVIVEGAITAGKRSMNPYDHALMSDFELSRIVAETVDKGEENCALAVANALHRKRLEADSGDSNKQGLDVEKEGLEGAVVVVVL
ncbi:hypothetical protein BGZ67_003461 [Mortierella alpina]|nr:hypothetical protein BGZ67_003461 [Mortierella alpina]